MAMSSPSRLSGDAGGGAGVEADDEVLSSINTTPLVDVMLVLLIIFLITIPAVNYSIAVQLPKERHELRETQPRDIVISVDAKGRLYWLDAPIASPQMLLDKLKAIAAQDPQPEVQIRGDLTAAYGGVGQILYACQRAGIRKVGFLTEPPPWQ